MPSLPGRNRNGAADPREHWSGVDTVVPPLWRTPELTQVAEGLPSRVSSIEALTAELLTMGAGYHRSLHQDEFGPSRSEQMSALRQILKGLDFLSTKLNALPKWLCAELDEALESYPLLAKNDDCAGSESYLADKDAVEAILGPIPVMQRNLSIAKKDQEARLLGEVDAAVETLAWRIFSLDSTTDIAVALEALSSDVPRPRGSGDESSRVRAPVERLRLRFARRLSRIKATRGPGDRPSLTRLIAQLSEIWTRETRTPVTANPYDGGDYASRPCSPAGRFICAAVEALQPSDEWIAARDKFPITPRARIPMLNRLGREQAVHSIMRDLVSGQ
jgi:hypothetical protein